MTYSKSSKRASESDGEPAAAAARGGGIDDVLSGEGRHENTARIAVETLYECGDWEWE